MDIARLLIHKAVYWSTSTPDGYGGSVFATPVEVDVRWENKSVIYKTPTGEDHVSQAVIYSITPFVLGSYLKLGTLDTLSNSSQQPQDEEDAYIIRGVVSMPGLRGTQSLITGYV